MSAADLASGKGHRDENFPVASFLIRPVHRPVIMAFYRFARAADDIADNRTATPEAKLAALSAMETTLLGEEDAEPTTEGLRTALERRGLGTRHATDLLCAFRQDVTQNRYATWDELIDYCRVSAMPVGRLVLDVHGEDRDLWPANDALCAALQIINHLQDCAADYRMLDRVYLPQSLLAATGAKVENLGADRATPALRATIGEMAERCQGLLARSAGFAREIRDRRLGMEVAVIQRLAESLATRLRTADPLGERVAHRKVEALGLAAGAALARWFGR